MYGKFGEVLRTELDSIREQGLYKEERVLESPQGAEITVAGKKVLNFCANNYLGLASDPRVTAAAKRALDEWGYGLSSVRFICGTTTLHKQLEAEMSAFLGMEDTILYAACFDANGGVFEPLLEKESAIIVLDPEDRVLFFKEGKLNKEDIQTAVALIKSELKDN